ncbi:MAG TPA: hypothetical protein VMI92_02755 [Steroidobacteraceae bacterium]|nr:hypothetical protein [Steroidobacteraceae bacterium]
MKRWILTGLLALGAAATLPAAAATSWADVGKWPDFQGGLWVQQRGPRGNATAPAYVPAVAAKLAALGPIAPETLGNANCEPLEGPFERIGEIFYSKDSIFMIDDEDFQSVRHIHLDTRDHGSPDPSYFGHSVGHWEGDTLVVDTVAFLPGVTLAPKVPGQGATHGVERFRLIAPDTLEQTVTLDNPLVLTKPFTEVHRYKLRRDLHVQEAFCAQNNRDLPVDGQPHLDLTAPR